MSPRLPLEPRRPLYRVPGLGLGRLIVAGILEWGLGLLNAAGLAGILFGPSETFFGRFRDYVMGIPNAVRGIRHYLHGGRHLEQLSQTAAYLDQHAPSPEEVRRLTAEARSWMNRLDIAREAIRDGLDQLGQGELIVGTSDVRWGLTNFPPMAEMDRILAATRTVTEPALELLRQVDLEPLLALVLNAADNLAADEILSTVTAMLFLGTAVWMVGRYLGTMWARRGVPGLLSRLWWKGGMRLHREWYEARTPELMGSLGLGARSETPVDRAPRGGPPEAPEADEASREP